MIKLSAETVFRGALTRVPLDWVDREKLEQQLTVSNPAFWTARQAGQSTTGIEPRIYLYEKDDHYYYVPRHYALPFTEKGSKLLEARGVRQEKRVAPKYVGKIKHSIKLRNKMQAEASAALQVPGDKILALACGLGKTILSLHAVPEAQKLPLLVIVHTNALMDQWKDRIQEFWRTENGGPVEVGKIQQDAFDWRGKPVAIAMLHTLVKKRYPQEFYDYWECVVADEVHKLGAQQFLKAASMFKCDRWGLSATLKREDGMDRAIRMHLGNVAYEHLEQPLQPRTFFVQTGIRVDERRYLIRNGRVNLAALTTDLASMEKRNKMIVDWVERAARNGRTVLILGERVTQLHELHNACQIESKSVHVGSMGPVDRKQALTKQVVFATQHLAKEGLDRPAFDTLFVLFTFGGEGRLQQSFGRILRVSEDKAQPKVIVFEDDVGIIKGMGNKMRRHLSRMSFPYKDIANRGFDG